jgi:hypothetical protein
MVPAPSNPPLERQFQQSFASSRRLLDAVAAIVILAVIQPVLSVKALKTLLCPETGLSASQLPNSCQDAAYSSQSAWLQSFPCNSSNAQKAAWWVQHWLPACAALQWRYGDLEGAWAHLASALVVAAVALSSREWYGRRRSAVMAVLRAGAFLTGLLAVVVNRRVMVGQLPLAGVHYSSATMWGATRLLWHAQIFAVS